MFLNLLRFLRVPQDLQQVRVGKEVEAWKLTSFLLQILSKGMVDLLQSLIHAG